MTAPRDVQQIEYRWVGQKDLTPVASSMPPTAEQSVDALIYSWVRHPDTDVTAESVRYQSLPDGRAVLAWRYRDPKAARREDGSHGRPIVSRAFVAQPDLLTPDVAIVLCRLGLPKSAGPRPAEAPEGTVLPPVNIDELRELALARAETMDSEAVREPGLARLLVAALSEPELPLAIQLRAPYLRDPLSVGPQPALLWGLWRIGRHLFDDADRGWSFSTYEAPLGTSDPTGLPDIVFRLDQPILNPPARSRPERRVRPRDPSAPAALAAYPELPSWLVEEYQAKGGDGLGRLLVECGAGVPVAERVGALYAELRLSRGLPPPEAVLAPASAQEHDADREDDPDRDQGRRAEQRGPAERVPDEPQEPEPPVPAQPDPALLTDRPQTGEQPAGEQPVTDYTLTEYARAQYSPRSYVSPAYTPPEYSSADTPTAPYPAASDDEQPPAPGYERPFSGYPSASWQQRRPGAEPGELRPPVAGPAPSLYLPARSPHISASQVPGPQPAAGRSQLSEQPPCPQPQSRVITVTELLGRLAAARDAQDFQSVLQGIQRPVIQPDQGDRRGACFMMQDSNWYVPHLLRYGYVPCETELAAIFRVVLLPDLELAQVQRQMAKWVLDAGPGESRALIRALLLAPPDAASAKRMRQLLRQALAVRLIAEYDCLDLWPSEPEPLEDSASGPVGSGFRRYLPRGLGGRG